jgi:hypothetical protein
MMSFKTTSFWALYIYTYIYKQWMKRHHFFTKRIISFKLK